MKKLTPVIGSIILAGIITLSSCTKEGATGATGATGASGTPGPSLTGSITGHIVLYDEYGGQQFGNESAAKVYVFVDGSAAAVDSVNADSAGVYTISNLQTGTYIMTFTCPGYGLMQRNAFGFTGGGTVNYDAKLSQMPDFTVTLTTFDSVNTAKSIAVFTCTLSSTSSKQRQLMVFIGDSGSVSPNPSTYLSSYAPPNIPSGMTSVTVNIPLYDIYNSILASGSRAYFTVCGATNNYNNSSEFEDLVTGRTVFTALSMGSAPVSFVLP